MLLLLRLLFPCQCVVSVDWDIDVPRHFQEYSVSWKWMSDDTHDVLCPLFACHWCALGFNTCFDKYQFRFEPYAEVLWNIHYFSDFRLSLSHIAI